MNSNQMKMEAFLLRVGRCNSLESLQHMQTYLCGFFDACPEGVDSKDVTDRFFELRNKREAELKGEGK